MVAVAHESGFSSRPPFPRKAFARRLAPATRECTTLDLDSDGESGAGDPIRGVVASPQLPAGVKREASADVDDPTVSVGSLSSALKRELSVKAEAVRSAESTREAIGHLLRRGFASAGASPEEAASWARSVEISAWEAAQTHGAEIQAGPKPMARSRRYRAEARRVVAALREPSVANQLVNDLRSGVVEAGGVLALPQESLLPAAKRARLSELRSAGGPRGSDAKRSLDFHDEHMVCQECAEAGGVTWEYMVSVRGGFNKAETWGSSHSAERSERCRAACGKCLAQWFFDM
mmetsp:Transcript_77879/g.225224  ORF Transcript_77879/g.225224 Transcript_77879/m.225224 type:complete len:291 (+) Transcript_77879:82-954(+)